MPGDDLKIDSEKRKQPEYSDYNLAAKKSKAGQVAFHVPTFQIGNLLGSGNVHGNANQIASRTSGTQSASSSW